MWKTISANWRRAQFGVEKHWHRRIVRSGPNSVTTAGDHPPVRIIEADDIVYLDLGPVFGGWEADIGKSYALGNDPAQTSAGGGAAAPV